ncbi:hypothetical protein LTR84_001185 [Exophiala bonariae]|uniref:Zn(2)-C6 fungal-type domain-containing protein n=1 Tax=Exophiala bonariae TaxID=1690606 RepID=A0AAV9NW41_9EURO|nr:hypothetical protein LTR84_001185 [Exophiala bonariae]
MSQRGTTMKRQRIAQACHQCRKRKSKCGGEYPACLVCLSGNRTCTYDESGFRKRGLQSGYVRGLEALLGLSLQDQAGHERRMRELLRSPSSRGRLNAGGITECADVWRHSMLARELEQIISHSEDSFGSASGVLSPLSDPEDICERPISGIADNDEDDEDDIGPDCEPSCENLQKGGASSPGPMVLTQLQLPEQAPELVDFYFSHIHCWLPMLERRDILRVLHSEKDVENSDPCLKCCLWAVIMLTLSRTKSIPEADQISKRILVALYLHLNNRLQEWRLEDVQALLIIVLLKIGLGEHQAAWILVGQAARMLLAHDHQPSRYNHTLLSCILLDNFLSALLNKKSCFPPDAPPFQPLDENLLEEWEPWNPPGVWEGREYPAKRSPLRAVSGFNMMSQLMHKISRLIHGQDDDIDYHAFLKELQIWKANLPAYQQMHRIQGSSPVVLNLELMWRFIVCSVVLRFNMEDPTIAQLALQNAHSILDIVQANICDENGSIPMLLGYLIQAQNSIETALEPQTPEFEDLVTKLRGLQYDLRRQWAPTDESAVPAIVHEDRYPDGMAEASRPSVSGTDFEGVQPLADPRLSGLIQDRDSSGAPWTQRADPITISRGQHHPRRMNGPQWSVETDENTFSERLDFLGVAQSTHSNDFDALLEGMSSFVPPKRSTLEPDFAQNLGFVNEDLDPEFLTFMHPEAMPDLSSLSAEVFDTSGHFEQGGRPSNSWTG